MSCVADVLVLLPLLLEHTSHAMMTPLGSEGGLHEMVSCITPRVADKLDTGPGTVQEHINTHIECNHSLTILQCLHSESCTATVWSIPSIIDCCHLDRVTGKWSQSSQCLLSIALSCNYNSARTVTQSVSSDGSTLARAGYCPPHYTQ